MDLRRFTENKISAAQGIAMLEVLIALIVVSIGVLGMAGMQLNGIRVAKGSYIRSQAVVYAETAVALMRANQFAVANMAYDGLDSANVNCNVKPNPYCYAYPGSSITTPSCTTEVAKVENDFFSVACGHWSGSKGENGLFENLPNGAITINCDDTPCTTTSVYTVAVTWSETEAINEVDTTLQKQVTMRVLP